MSFVQPQRNAARHSAGIGVAILFHIVLIWALMNGLAHKVMQVINAPIETKIIEEIKPPPPPPRVIELPPPPKFAPPPPAFAPPPEVQVQATPPLQPTITTTTAVAPVEPAPVVGTRVEVPKAAAAASPVSASVACSNYSRVMGEAAFPRAATRLGLEEGDALIQFTLGANGDIKDIKAIRASHTIFADNSIRLVSAFKCTGKGADASVQVPFAYKSE